jgi:hypothetical protein
MGFELTTGGHEDTQEGLTTKDYQQENQIIMLKRMEVNRLSIPKLTRYCRK